jgi:hypothetical protein
MIGSLKRGFLGKGAKSHALLYRSFGIRVLEARWFLN